MESSSTKIANVDKSGIFIPIKERIVTITVTTKNSKKATVKIKVINKQLFTLPFTITPTSKSWPTGVCNRCATGRTISERRRTRSFLYTPMPFKCANHVLIIKIVGGEKM